MTVPFIDRKTTYNGVFQDLPTLLKRNFRSNGVHEHVKLAKFTDHKLNDRVNNNSSVISSCGVWTVEIFQEMIDQVIDIISMQTSERVSAGTTCSQHQNSVQIHSFPKKRTKQKSSVSYPGNEKFIFNKHYRKGCIMFHSLICYHFHELCNLHSRRCRKNTSTKIELEALSGSIGFLNIDTVQL